MPATSRRAQKATTIDRTARAIAASAGGGPLVVRRNRSGPSAKVTSATPGSARSADAARRTQRVEQANPVTRTSVIPSSRRRTEATSGRSKMLRSPGTYSSSGSSSSPRVVR